MVLDLNKKTFFVISGASRGIGQTMALHVAKKLGDKSTLVLLARNEAGLLKTKNQIDALGKELQVHTHSIDFSVAKAEDFKKILEKSLESSGEKASNFERAFIIHGAGDVGDVSKRATETNDIEIWRKHFHMNHFSVVALNCEFFNLFSSVPKIIVFITSKTGIEPFISMSYYCSSKAATEMYFRVLATEQTENTLVLNYAPGAIDTDMTIKVQEQTINTDLSNTFKKLRETKEMLSTEQTSIKFLEVLEAQKFKSGDHVDYWD